VPCPEIFVGGAAKKFDEDGKFTEGIGRKPIGDHVLAFKAWILPVRAQRILRESS
jgi:hypothetical protein